ncbi:MAG: type III pantothenate kinase [Planctomycetota bacterium]
MARPLAERARKEFGARMLWVERDLPIPIGRRLDPESIVGQDRLLNAAAAWDGIKQACVVIDAGTAITVDFVDGEGTFHGGAILPGARLQLQSMFENTELLPEVTFEPPDEGTAFGANTVQAMRHGVFYGIRGAVRHLIERYAEFYEAYPHVVATGGDAHMLFDGDELIEHVVDDLTLQGIAVTARTAIEEHEG